MVKISTFKSTFVLKIDFFPALILNWILFIISLAQRAGDVFWISLNDFGSTGSWNWDSNGASLTFANWRAGEPNNLGVEQCAELTATERQWNNNNCGVLRKYVCEGFQPRS